MPQRQALRGIGSRASNCILLTTTVVCIGLLVVCGVMVVREYSLASAYVATTCRVANVSYDDNPIGCMFCATKEKGKKDKGTGMCTHTEFPCVHIHVVFNVQDERYEGFLHPDSLQAAGLHKECSYDVCLKLAADNTLAVRGYANGWLTKNTAFECFYDQSNYRQVIAHKMHTKAEVIHFMFWPSLVIVICGAVFLRLEMNRRDIGFCPHGEKAEEQRYKCVEGSAVGKDISMCLRGGAGQGQLIHDCPPVYTSGSLPTLDNVDAKRHLHVPTVKLSISKSLQETFAQADNPYWVVEEAKRRRSYTAPPVDNVCLSTGKSTVSGAETPV